MSGTSLGPEAQATITNTGSGQLDVLNAVVNVYEPGGSLAGTYHAWPATDTSGTVLMPGDSQTFSADAGSPGDACRVVSLNTLAGG